MWPLRKNGFSDVSLTDGLTFMTALIKRAKSIINIFIPHDTKKRRREISINNGYNTQVVQILCGERVVKFIFKGKLLRRPPKPVEISHEWVLKISNIRSQNFTLDYLMIHKEDLLNPLQVLQRKNK